MSDECKHGEYSYGACVKCGDHFTDIIEEQESSIEYGGELVSDLRDKLQEQQTKITKLEKAIKVTAQTVREVRHAQDQGASWYTRGSGGLFQQVRLWLNKADEALAELDKGRK